MTGSEERLEHLDGRRFTAAQVLRAADISQHALTNYLSKSSLELCSESAGQGRARKFCLVDVYQIALLSEMSAVTGSVGWCAEALNDLLFEKVEWGAIADAAERKGFKHIAQSASAHRDPLPSMRRRSVVGRSWKAVVADLSDGSLHAAHAVFKDQVCESIKMAPKLYWHRDVGEPPFFIWATFEQFTVTGGTLDYGQRGDAGFMGPEFTGGIVWNVTATLRRVDERLFASLPKGDADVC